MTLLTTDTMQQVQDFITGHPVDNMESETFSVRCPSCNGCAWGFDDTPESGIGHCPYCRATLYFRDYKIKTCNPVNA